MAVKQAKSTLKKVFKALIFVLLFIVVGFNNVKASSGEEVEFDASEVILHHVVDDHVWHFFDGHYGTLHLPIIVYSQSKGLDVFSSSNFYDKDHNIIPYNGYELAHGHISIIGNPEEYVLDVSITKTVLMLLITATLIFVIFLTVAKQCRTNEGKAPKGLQSFFEPIVIYLRDEVIKPNIGKGYEKYMPYLLTLFFFILIGNLLGLLPGAANLTGNIAVTFVMAVFTFVITNFSGNKNYWKHIFVAPGVPLALKPLIVLVEFIGVFTKPISLTIRLFVAITAGHIVMLSLIALTFIFSSIYVGFASTLIVLFINLIELLVAAIQAYVFTMFSALYIGLATEEHH